MGGNSSFIFTTCVRSVPCYHFSWGGGGGAHVKILTGMLVLFFGFEIWPNPIFLVLANFLAIFLVLANFLAIFLGFAKFPLFSWV